MVVANIPTRGRTHDASLAVWANGEQVGTWTALGGNHRFQYEQAWLASPYARPLSLSLPFRPGNDSHQGDAVRNFFENLLPDSTAIRQRLRDRYRTGGTDAFALLAAIGRDCVGAVQLLPLGLAPTGFDRIDAQPLVASDVERLINAMLASGQFVQHDDDDDFRISIAGAQEKTALLWHEGRWCKPLGATPTTHILKLALGIIGGLRYDMRASVENEWLCSEILNALGIPAARCEIESFGNWKVLVVERFDRVLLSPAGRSPWIARLPQEDFCQALGVAPEHKYEAHGGPGMQAILRQLSLGSRPDEDRLTFAKAQLAFWLMAATDGHAKNFSVFLEPGGSFRLTPLYDVLSAWPIIGNGPNQLHDGTTKLAMALRSKNAHYNLREIQTTHWALLAARTGVADAVDELAAMVLTVPAALAEVKARLPDDFPGEVFEAVAAGMMRQAEAFVDGMS